MGLFSYIRNLFKSNKKKEEPNYSSQHTSTIIVDSSSSSIDSSIDDYKYPISEPLKQYPNLIVCLDNGHGENTPGKCSPYSAYQVEPELPFREYKWARELVDILKEKLEDHGVEVFIVTPEEKDIPLKTRYQRINKKKAENPDKKILMVSIHVNAAGDGKQWMNARGWSAYTTKGQNNSDKLADCLYDAAEEILLPLGQKIRTDKSDGDRDWEANFTIIYGSNTPAVLTENLFQDNVDDVKFLTTYKGKNAIAELHKKGILKFAEKMWNM